MMRLLGQALVCLAMMVGAGCNKGPSVALFPVTGTVTYQGKPVVGATVTFMSKNRDDPAASGETDSEGHFSLLTYFGPSQVLRGAPSGDYKVTIVKATPGESASMNQNPESMSDRDRAELVQKELNKMMQHMVPGGNPNGAPPPKPKSEIPVKYAQAETSGIHATVLAEKNDPFEFKLTDD